MSGQECPRSAPLSLDSLRARGKRALAETLVRLERHSDDPVIGTLLDEAWQSPRAHVVGVTGPPGVGKSSLCAALVASWRRSDRTVAVIAVDPSSQRSGGALLGDRTRIATDPADAGCFVRSMAARDRLGGLADLTVAATVVMRALYDVVLIETVGVGQSETDVAGVADSVVFCVQPGSGDALQFMKAGIVEIPHVVAVTKGDLGSPAERAQSDVAGALSLADEAGDGWLPMVLVVSAQSGLGIPALLAAIDAHRAHLDLGGRLGAARLAQAELWLREAIRDRFGREGLERAGELRLTASQSPFARIAEISRNLRV